MTEPNINYPSERYLRALGLTQRHHAAQDKTFSGQFTWKQRHRIKVLIERFGAASMLDYGCGKGKQYDPARNRDTEGRSLEEFWGIAPTRYDPGVPAYAAEPQGKFDLVICVQVLGSIPTADLPWVIDRLYGFAGKAIFVAERLILPRKQIYQSMRAEMPYGHSAEHWLGLLERDGGVPLIAMFREADRGWYQAELNG